MLQLICSVTSDGDSRKNGVTTVLMDLSFQLSDPKAIVQEYAPQVVEIFNAIHDSGLSEGHLHVSMECLSWMLMRDHQCVGNAEVDTRRQSIHIRFDQLDFKLAAVYKSTVWKSKTLVRMVRPEIKKHPEKKQPRPQSGWNKVQRLYG